MKVLILDGPHKGELDVPETQGDVLQLADEPGLVWTLDPSVAPAVVHRYIRVQSYPTDFLRGIEARYICVD